MVIVGLNLPINVYGKHLNDGGVCVIIDNKIAMAVAEERVSRNKRDGGYKTSLEYMMGKLDIGAKDIDIIVYSSCCEVERLNYKMKEFKNARFMSCNHHLSHAISVYHTSMYSKAIIVVLDAGGQIIGRDNLKKWWRGRREQQSYYVARGEQINLIGRDFSDPDEAGIGEIYRAVTYHLGWPSSRHASKTMALSGYGDPNTFVGKKIYYFKNGRMFSRGQNSPENPSKMVLGILKKCGTRGFNRREEYGKFQQNHKDLAAWVQDATEKTIYRKIDYLIKKTGIKNICLAGGVAYNCAVIGKIAENTCAEGVYVHPASGDHGQCLGNAIYGYCQAVGPWKREDVFNPFLGGEEEINKRKIKESSGIDLKKYKISEMTDTVETVAGLLMENEIVAWFQGRSEYGPRALGHRSILANPAYGDNKERLNRIKGRESFMPFAPSVLAEKATDYFENHKECPYMTAAYKVRPEKVEQVPVVVHVDGSSRIQTVSRDHASLYRDLIERFYLKSSIPLIVNTSFNGAGEAIVETITDAMNSFKRLDLKYMAIGNILVEKVINDKSYSVRANKYNIMSYDMKNITIHELRKQLSTTYNNLRLSPRNKFHLHKKFVGWVISGKKITTIRYRKNGIDYPQKIELPLYSTEDFSFNSKGKYIGCINIDKYTVKQYCNLNEVDATNDGFNTLLELKGVLEKIYGDIQDNDYVSIYHINLKS